MSLQVWLPLIKNLNNQGIGNATITASSTTFALQKGKIGNSCFTSSSTVTINLPVMANAKIWSLCFWGYIDSSLVTSDWTRAATLQDGGSNLRIETCPKGGYGNGIYCFCQSNNSSCKIISASVSDIVGGHYDQWLHFCITSDGSTVSVYRNGNLDGTVPYSGNGAINGIFTIENSDKIYKNDYRIYDHCLSPKEVKEISKALVVHFPLGDEFIEGTTNLIDVQYKSSGGGGWGGHTSTWTEYDSTNDPIPCNKCTKMAITYSGSNNGGVGMAVKGISSSASTTYCYSCYVKTPDALGPLNANILYRYEYDSNNTKTIEAGCWTSSNYQSLGNNWYRVWGTFTTTANTVRFDVYSFVYPNKTCDYYIGCWQLELKDHVTPYIFGTRNETIIHDTSGFKNNGTLNAAFKCLTDTPRYLYSTFFDGNTNCILFPFDAARSSDGIFTMNLWFKKTEIGSKNYESLVGGPSGFEMDTRSGSSTTLSLYMASTRGGNMFSPFELNQWYMVTMVNDGTNEKYYVNGSLKKTIEKKSMPTGNYYIGSWRDATSQNYKGMISDFRLYNTALSDANVLELYQTSASIDNGGNVLGYEFDE